MRLAFFLAFATLGFGCGDIIKAKNPFKKSKPYQPETLQDETGSCPYYPAIWTGTCKGEGQDPRRMYHLNLTQSFCTFFIANQTSFNMNNTQSHDVNGVLHSTSATWLNTKRTQLSLIDQWQEQSGRELESAIVLDHSAGTAQEQRYIKGDASQVISSCEYHRGR